ncbi:superfamily II DNA or RNA helicase [Lipingzhangella halophila]|uniref:Superfamily II DNA or RNA helicase n=1 Tax=Lipingzhangella halophila TaxID=1783352 RepID=A0A7W7RLZ7_9ACTN|nr:DEAD/DEAH box helicase [Lipingzhangella halophila]MBB4934443.1 superfamily II DNA or RNA helicase [Lipingzhangella halophila]
MDQNLLRPHQVESVEASLKALARQSRVHDVMACGTGKTRVGRALADALLPEGGRVLVAAPRINLLIQALAEYRLFGDAGLGEILVVCSDRHLGDDTRLAGLAVSVTTDPERIAATGRAGRLTCFCTYDSLGALIEAHQRGMPPWDLLLADEAHYLIGRGAWARIHDDAAIPARRRKYTTATPRVVHQDDRTGDPHIASMDDQDVFGERAYEFSFAEAIRRGLLAPFRVVTPVITRTHVRQLVARSQHLELGRAAISADVAALQVATLKAMVEFGGQRALTFHPRRTDARLWAINLGHIPALLEDWDGQVWAHHLNGDHHGRQRSRVLEEFATPTTDTAPVKRFVTNVALFRDGFDAPGCDTIVVTHPITSTTMGVQMLSRALRVDPDRLDKVATFILPILLGEDDAVATAVESPVWEPVWAALRALGSMDNALLDWARAQRRRHGAHTDQTQDAGTRLPSWWHIRGVPMPETFAAAIGVRAMRTLAPSDEEYLGACEAFRAAHAHLRIPQDHVTAHGLQLGEWFRYKRRCYNAGARGPVYDHLEQLGATFNYAEKRKQAVRTAVDDYYRQHGHLNVPGSFVTDDGIQLGSVIRNTRRLYHKGKVSPEDVSWWNSYDMIWSYQEAIYQSVDDYYRQHGHLDVPADYVTENGVKLGSNIQTVRHKGTTGALTPEEVAWWNSYDMIWDASTLARKRQSDRKWETGFAFAQRYYQRNGDLHVRKKDNPIHDEVGRFHLYDWLKRQQRNWHDLPQDKRHRLANIGFVPTWKSQLQLPSSPHSQNPRPGSRTS